MRLVILGAGGFSREVYDLATACGHAVVGFVDDVAEGLHEPTGLTIARDPDHFEADGAAVAVGDTVTRAEFFKRFGPRLEFATLIHPSACISPSATVGPGCLVMQNVVVNAQALVGADVILNVGCCIAHDCVVGSHSHIAPAVQMAGGSSVGELTFCGTAAVVLPGVHVGTRCVLGAGTVVTRHVADGQTVVGVPARPL